MVLRYMAEFASATGNPSCHEYCSGLLAFLTHVQRPWGELPYSISQKKDVRVREHLQCFQYHGFMCLDFCRYYELSFDARCLGILKGIVTFLLSGVGSGGWVKYQCGASLRRVTYHAAAVAVACSQLENLGLMERSEVPSRLAATVLGSQSADGSFPHSQGDYGLLHDARSYPRYLAMILYHLVLLSTTTNQPA
jgi:hypothetical protein